MNNTYLVHWRTPGSKNGRRLYQNKDGSLTPLGREHYGVGPPRQAKSESSLSKWAAKRKAEKAAKAESKASVRKVSDMSDEELRSGIKRMELERDYKKAMAENNPKKSSFIKELGKLGVDVLKDTLKDVAKQKVSTFIQNSLNGTGNAKAIASKKAFQEWKDHHFDPDYAPTSVKNRYSEAYVNELNRAAKVKAQQKDHSFNSQQGDTKYWQRIYDQENVAATKPAREKKNAWETAKEAAAKAQAVYEKAQNGQPTSVGLSQAKSDLDKANVAEAAARKAYLDARDELTEDQRKLLK